MLIQQIINGLSIGALYALLALGLSLAYATGRVVNFAHGDLFSLGAFLTVSLHEAFGGYFLLDAVVSSLLVGGVGTLFGWYFLWRLQPLERSVATIVIGLGMRDGMLIAFGSDSASLPGVYAAGAINIGAVTLPWGAVIVAGITVALLVSTWWLVSRTQFGVQMRATAENPGLAARSGIVTRRVQAAAFGLSCGLAAAAGATLIPIWQVYSGAGVPIGLKAFAAAMLGGFGRLGGAVVGGLCIGVGEALVSGYVSSTWKDLVMYSGLLIIVAALPRHISRAGVPRVS